MRGIKIQWTAEMDAKLVEGIRNDLFNFEIAASLGISKRSVNRRMVQLGIERIEGFNERTVERRSILLSEALKGCVNAGSIKKGEHRYPAGEFPNRKISPEARRAGNIRGAAKRKDTFQRERLRARYGLPQKTKMNVNEPSRRSDFRRTYLRRYGYHIERGSYVAVYDENTTRRPKAERTYRNFTFRAMTDNELYDKAIAVPWEMMDEYIDQIQDGEMRARLRRIKRDRYHIEND